MSLVGELRFEPVTRRVRASLGGRPVLDTTDAVLVWEPRRVVPMYAVPPGDVAAALVPCAGARGARPAAPGARARSTSAWHHTPGRSYDVVVGDRTVPAAALRPGRPRPRRPGRRRVGTVRLGRGGPPGRRSPARPVQADRPAPERPARRRSASAGTCSPTPAAPSRCTRPTSRCAGTSPTTTSSPTCSSAAPRPRPAPTRATPSTSRSPRTRSRACGAEGEDIAWTYTHPLDEVAAIKGMVCFYSERTDLELDGVAVPRPVTPWSSPRDQERS